MSDSRTVRARVNDELAGHVDMAMEMEGRTESDVVRRALWMYVSNLLPARVSFAGGKTFNGPDPRKK